VPSIVNLYTIYTSDYSLAVGILEVQINLDRVLSGVSLVNEGAALYLKHGGLCVPVREPSDGAPVEITALLEGQGEVLIENTEYSGFELMIQKQKASIQNTVVINLLLFGLVLLVPTFVLWLFIYRFASRLLNFSRHIRQNNEAGLTSYEAGAGNDEFGIVVTEYNNMARTINELIESVREAEKLKNDASYYAMSSQVNPHFMFNTLENIRMRIEIEEYETAGEMLVTLSNFLRYSISLRRESTLFDEIGHIRHYMTIYQYRQSDQVAFSINIAENVENIECPFCILQPIVENCIKHAMPGISSRLEITVDARALSEGVEVRVSDNGCGMPSSRIEEMNRELNMPPARDDSEQNNGAPGGVGISNVNNRLKYFYGDAYGVTFQDSPAGGLSCIVYMGYGQKNGAMTPYMLKRA